MKVKELVALLLAEDQDKTVTMDYGGAIGEKRAYANIEGVTTDEVYSVDAPSAPAYGVVVIE